MVTRLWQRLGGAAVVGVLLLVFVLGYAVRGCLTNNPPTQPAATTQPAHQPDPVWTCSMHPQIRQPKPGPCPLCGMDLIPAADPGAASSPGTRRLVVTPEAAKLMDIQTTPVQRRFVHAVVRMVGKVDFDETRLSDITAWVGGRLDRLYVDYTGVTVNKGDHMVELYSPQLLSAQEELLQAIQTVRELESSGVDIVREATQATVQAAREKLRLWGITESQIQEIEQRGTARDHVTISSPVSGVVIHKHAQEGMYVQTGTRIYTIADLTHVWVRFDAYESDLAWLRYGQAVRFTTQAHPGQAFRGTIAFIDPVLNDKTRTVKVRVNITNPQGLLKPGMFVRGTVHADVANDGRVMDPDLVGKWICPMHPEVVKDQSDSCDICGMALVKAQDLGYIAPDETESAKPLVVPASAVLVTGKRAIVYVKQPHTDPPAFEGREITLGPRAGDDYIVQGNLREGELVVTHGNFKIDSALQLQAKPSMMNPHGNTGRSGHPHAGHAHE